MGFHCQWIAVRGRTRDEVLKIAGLSVAKELREEIVDPGLWGVQIAKWFIVFGDGWDFMTLVERTHAVSASRGAEAMWFVTDDSSMTCELAAFADRKVAWSIRYGGGLSKVKIGGTPPAIVNKHIAARTKQQKGHDDVDYIYDVAPTVAKSIVGFRHGETLAAKPRQVLALTRTAAPKKRRSAC